MGLLKQLLVTSQPSAESIVPEPTWGCISISGNRTEVKLQEGWGSVLSLKFNDITRPTQGFVHFDEQLADTLLNWVEVNILNGPIIDRLLIHCEAGVSRSQAVALFIQEYYAKYLDELKGTASYNRLVYSTLRQRYEERNKE